MQKLSLLRIVQCINIRLIWCGYAERHKECVGWWFWVLALRRAKKGERSKHQPTHSSQCSAYPHQHYVHIVRFTTTPTQTKTSSHRDLSIPLYLLRNGWVEWNISEFLCNKGTQYISQSQMSFFYTEFIKMAGARKRSGVSYRQHRVEAF